MSDEAPPKPPLPPPPPPAGASAAGLALQQLDGPFATPLRAVSGPIARAESGAVERAQSGPIERAQSGPIEPAAAAPGAAAPSVARRPPVRAESGTVSVRERASAEQAPAATDAKPEQSRPERLVSWPAPDAGRSADDQLEQRRARIVERVATVRDAFRLLCDVGVSEDARKGVAQALQELQTAIGGASAASASKDPKLGLAAAGKDVLDAVEPLLGSIEDKLLALDDQIDDATFEARAPGAARNKRVLARHGRLLASRRLPAGARRNRFEWLALQLLTRTNESGQLLVAPPERASQALQHLIGDLPYKVRREEIDQVTDYLYEAGKRLDALQSAEELFESGLYSDVHGYKVTMREHLLSPEVVYRTALFEARLHNHLERFIAQQAQASSGDEAFDASALRSELRARLRAEREDVDASLGAKSKQAVGAPAVPGPVPRPAPSARKRPPSVQATETLLKRRRLRVALDRGLLVGIAAVLVFSVAVFVVRQQGGPSSGATTRKLTREELPALSPLLVTAEVRTLDDDQTMRGWISGTRWRALDPVARRSAAELLAKNLFAAKVQAAKLYDGPTLVLVIHDGIVVSAAGAAP